MARQVIKNTQTKEEIVADVQDVILDENSQASQAYVESDTKLEYDEGFGHAVVIRQFTFGMNLDTFKNNPVSKQELFNHHLKQIEILLWQDGLKIMTDVQPQLQINSKKKQYTIIVGAMPQRGNILPWAGPQPKKLSEIV